MASVLDEHTSFAMLNQKYFWASYKVLKVFKTYQKNNKKKKVLLPAEESGAIIL